MHVYSIAETSQGALQVHAVGRNSRMEVSHKEGGATSWRPPTPAMTPAAADKGKEKEKEKEREDGAGGRPALHSRASDSGVSEASSSVSHSHSHSHAHSHSHSHSHAMRPPPKGDDALSASALDTSAGEEFSTANPAEDDTTLGSMDPPAAPPRPLSRRSSTSGSHAASPSLAPSHSHQLPLPLRSPSPAPLPAVKVPLSPTILPTQQQSSSSSSGAGAGGKIDTLKLYTDANSTPFFRRLTWSTDGSLLLTPAGLFEDPYAGVGAAAVEKQEGAKKGRKSSTPVSTRDKDKAATGGPKPTVYIYSRSNVARPPIAHLPGHRTTSIAIRFCPVLFDLRRLKADEADEEEEPLNVELTKEGVEVRLPSGEEEEDSPNDKGKSSAGTKPRSLFDLPYRMVYAVATLDSVYLYDTQQAAPIAMFGNLHYAPFTDLSW